jgi:putative methylase
MLSRARRERQAAGARARPVRSSELVLRLSRVPPFARPNPRLEQVATPAEAAAELLLAAERFEPLEGHSVLDLGLGTGRLAIGAALLGARPVTGVEIDPEAAEVARRAAEDARVTLRIEVRDVTGYDRPADVVVLNPPFGAQRRHADRPFWDTALLLARRSVHGFALAESRTFIARRAVERAAHVIETRPVAWELGRIFPHHTRNRVSLKVDRWVIDTGTHA